MDGPHRALATSNATGSSADRGWAQEIDNDRNPMGAFRRRCVQWRGAVLEDMLGVSATVIH